MLEEYELEPLMARPDLPTIVEKINNALSEETRCREAFRNDLSPSVKAEFIAGEVVMHSPAKAKHLRVTDKLVRLLSTYVQLKELGEAFSEKALICLTRNDYEPDVCFFGNEKAASFNDDTMEFPAPDFVVEVLSESTAHRDRGVKMDDYAIHAVNEYWIIDCDEQTVEQYLLDAGERKYHLALKLKEGEIESVVVTGFRIPVAALFNNKENQRALKKMFDGLE